MSSGANFYPVGIADVLQHWLGDSERALHEHLRDRPPQRAVRAVLRRGRRARSTTRRVGQQLGPARRRQCASRRAGYGHVDQRRRVRARRHQHAVGRRPGAAPAGPLRPDDLRRPARRGRPRRHRPDEPARPARRADRPGVGRQAHRRLLGCRRRACLRHRNATGDGGLVAVRAGAAGAHERRRRRALRRSGRARVRGSTPHATWSSSPTATAPTTSWRITCGARRSVDRWRVYGSDVDGAVALASAYVDARNHARAEQVLQGRADVVAGQCGPTGEPRAGAGPGARTTRPRPGTAYAALAHLAGGRLRHADLRDRARRRRAAGRRRCGWRGAAPPRIPTTDWPTSSTRSCCSRPAAARRAVRRRRGVAARPRQLRTATSCAVRSWRGSGRTGRIDGRVRGGAATRSRRTRPPYTTSASTVSPRSKWSAALQRVPRRGAARPGAGRSGAPQHRHRAGAAAAVRHAGGAGMGFLSSLRRRASSRAGLDQVGTGSWSGSGTVRCCVRLVWLSRIVPLRTWRSVLRIQAHADRCGWALRGVPSRRGGRGGGPRRVPATVPAGRAAAGAPRRDRRVRRIARRAADGVIGPEPIIAGSVSYPASTMGCPAEVSAGVRGAERFRLRASNQGKRAGAGKRPP